FPSAPRWPPDASRARAPCTSARSRPPSSRRATSRSCPSRRSSAMAAKLKVVLLEDVENLGRVGEIVSVKGGHGRNYLIPQGKALLATKGNLALMGARRKIYEVAAAQAREAAAEIAGRIAA